MAEQKEVVETTTKSSTTPKSSDVATTNTVSPLWWVLGTLVVVTLVIFTAGATRQLLSQRDNSRADHNFGFGMDDRHMMRGGMMHDDLASDDSHVGGVVTNISGSTLTIAGNGTTKKVTVNDSTEYYGAAQPVKINDSVQIIGTTSNDTFTASRIMISRQ